MFFFAFDIQKSTRRVVAHLVYYVKLNDDLFKLNLVFSPFSESNISFLMFGFIFVTVPFLGQLPLWTTVPFHKKLDNINIHAPLLMSILPHYIESNNILEGDRDRE